MRTEDAAIALRDQNLACVVQTSRCRVSRPRCQASISTRIIEEGYSFHIRERTPGETLRTLAGSDLDCVDGGRDLRPSVGRPTLGAMRIQRLSFRGRLAAVWPMPPINL